MIPFQAHDANYAVMIKIQDTISQEEPDILRYEIQLRCLKTEGGHNWIEVKKTDVLFNEEEVQDAFNDILLLTAQALDRVILHVDSFGKANGLANYAEIVQKWRQAREMVEAQYQGEVVQEYLDSMQEHLVSPETTWKALKKNLFHTLFYSGVYTSLASSHLELHELLPKQAIVLPVHITSTQEMEGLVQVQLESGSQEIQMDVSERNQLEVESGIGKGTPIKADVKLEYVFADKGKIIEARLQAALEARNQYGRQVEVEVKEIERS